MLKKISIPIIFSASFLILLLILFVSLKFINNTNKLSIEDVSNRLNLTTIDTSNMQDVSIEYIINTIGIDAKYIKDYIGKIPIINVSSSMYILIQTPSSTDAKKVVKKLEEYGEIYEKSWDSFLLSEQDLVRNRKIDRINNFAYIVVSEDIF